jgi:hypothetical protein
MNILAASCAAFENALICCLENEPSRELANRTAEDQAILALAIDFACRS